MDYYLTQDEAIAVAGGDPGRAVWTPRGWMAVGAELLNLDSPSLSIADDVISAFDFMTLRQIKDVQSGQLRVDVTDPLKKFFDACANGPSGFMPRGRYKLKKALNLDPAAGYDVRGVRYSPSAEAAFATALYQFGDAEDGIRIIDNAYSGVAGRMIRLEDFNIVGMGSARNGIAVQFSSVFFKRLWVSGFSGYGARLDSIWSSTFDQCVFAHNYQYGAFMAADGNAVTFNHCVFNANAKQDGFAGLGITGPEWHENVAVKIQNCDFTSNGQTVDVKRGYGLVVQRSRGVSVDSCYFESNKWRNFYADGTACGLSVKNNYFQDADNEITEVDGLEYCYNDHRNAFLDHPLVVRISGGFPALRCQMNIFGNVYRNSATVGFSGGAGTKADFFVTSQPPDGVGKQNDIAWNTAVGATGYIGWVCYMDGTTPRWRGF